MCRHILNAQTYFQAPCCERWFECAECHDEVVGDHVMTYTPVFNFTCKKCRKVFQKDMRLFFDADKVCPHCDNVWVLPAITPETKIMDEIESEIDRQIKGFLFSNLPRPADAEGDFESSQGDLSTEFSGSLSQSSSLQPPESKAATGPSSSTRSSATATVVATATAAASATASAAGAASSGFKAAAEGAVEAK